MYKYMYNVRLTLADNELKDDLIKHLYKNICLRL